MASHAGDHPELGSYATSRRGGLSSAEMREIRAHRAKARPTPWQALASMYGRPVAEIQALFGPAANDNASPAVAETSAPEPKAPRLRGDALWTKHNLQLLRLATEAGYTSDKIAAMVGCSPGAVRAKRVALGISKGAAL